MCCFPSDFDIDMEIDIFYAKQGEPFRPVLPPSLPYPRRQGTSLIVGWASQWGLVESKRIADGIPVIHQHE